VAAGARPANERERGRERKRKRRERAKQAEREAEAEAEVEAERALILFLAFAASAAKTTQKVYSCHTLPLRPTLKQMIPFSAIKNSQKEPSVYFRVGRIWQFCACPRGKSEKTGSSLCHAGSTVNPQSKNLQSKSR
jgi:hypothetical protein